MEQSRGRGRRPARAPAAVGLVCGGALVVILASVALARAAPAASLKSHTHRAAAVLMDTSAIASVASPSQLSTQQTPTSGSHRRFSWAVLAAAILGALLVAGYIGNTFVSHRPARPKPSIYAVIEARLKEEKAGPHSLESESGDGTAAETGSLE